MSSEPNSTSLSWTHMTHMTCHTFPPTPSPACLLRSHWASATVIFFLFYKCAQLSVIWRSRHRVKSSVTEIVAALVTSCHSYLCPSLTALTTPSDGLLTPPLTPGLYSETYHTLLFSSWNLTIWSSVFHSIVCLYNGLSSPIPVLIPEFIYF